MKKELLKKLHTHMFDGEGGDGGAEAGTPQGEGAESVAEPTVVYGNAEVTTDDAGQIGTDGGKWEKASEKRRQIRRQSSMNL